MPTIGTTSKPAYVYDAGTDTWIPIGPGEHTHDYAASAHNHDSAYIASSLVDAKGDLLVGSADNTVSRLAVGTDGYYLTADSAEASGVKWAAAAAGGKVLQVVQGTLTSTFTTTSTSLTDTGLTVSITPSSASNKVMIIVSGAVHASRSGSGNNATSEWALLQTTTQLQKMNVSFYWSNNENNPEINGGLNFSYLDAPNTTSATTYKVQGRTLAASTTAGLSALSTVIPSIVAMEIGA